MASGEVIGGVFLAADELFRVEELPIHTSPDLVDDGGLEVHEHGAWHVFPGTGLGEERVEGVVSAADGLVARHLSIWLGRRKKNLKKKNQKPPKSEAVKTKF